MNFYLLMVISCIKWIHFEVCENIKSESRVVENPELLKANTNVHGFL